METERRRREKKKKTNVGKLLLLLVILIAVVLGIFFACNAAFSEKPLPIVYEKNGVLMVKNDREDQPFTVSENYAGGKTALIQDGDGLLFTDMTGALCFSNIKTAKSAKETTVLSDNVYNFFVADDAHIYYIKNDILFENNLKGEKEIATGAQEIVVSEDGRFVFFNTATDLFGIDTENGSAPVRIAENVTVYNLLHTAIDWTIDSENLYYISGGRFAHLNEDLSETLLCENAAIGFVLGDAVYAVTETQIDEDKFKTALVKYDGENVEQIASDLIGTEAVSQLYTQKTYMLFTKQSEENDAAESYYTLDAKGNFRYLCENENYKSLFTDNDGKKAYIHTADGDLVEYKLSGKAELKEKSAKLIISGVQNAYAVDDHIGVSSDLMFGIYHNGKYEPVYDDGEPHYQKLLVANGKAYICDQSGAAPFYICKGGKLNEIDTGVITYALISDTRVAYLKNNDTNGETWDLYKIDKNKQPVLVDTNITALH